MTKRREPLTYHHALTVIAAQIGWDRCAAIVGKVDRTVRLWSDPDCETEIRLIDAERLDRAFIAAGGDHAPFHRLHALRLELAAIQNSDRSLVDVAGSAAKEAGEAVAALIDAAGKLECAATRRTAKIEIEQAIGKLQDGLAIIQRASGEQGGDHVR